VRRSHRCDLELQTSRLPTWRVVPPTTAPPPGLLAIRMQRGLTQRMLAERSGVDRATVARLEAGSQARMDTLSKLAAGLDLEPGDLMAQPPEA
jgi:DNA-binding Xre family transcriptional regulator